MSQSSIIPHQSFDDIRLEVGEPFSHAYFNAHIRRFFDNLDYIRKNHTIHRATDSQYGVVRMATVDEVISPSSGSDGVITNDIFNKALKKIEDGQLDMVSQNGSVALTDTITVQRGEFTVSPGVSLAKKITSDPSNVIFSSVYFVPVGNIESQFPTASIDTTQQSFFDIAFKSAGYITFENTTSVPPEFKDFHVYYHDSGYVIVKNTKFSKIQGNIRVVWILGTKIK